jgi:hypothetical protein
MKSGSEVALEADSLVHEGLAPADEESLRQMAIPQTYRAHRLPPMCHPSCHEQGHSVIPPAPLAPIKSGKKSGSAEGDLLLLLEQVVTLK